MSWDVMVFNFRGNPPDLDAADEDEFEQRRQPLGPADEVRAAIAEALPGVDWTDPSWGTYRGGGFSFEISTGDEDPIDFLTVHVRGGGDPIPALLQFAVPNNWSLMDCSTSEFIDPQNPSDAGWRGFQSFRDRALGKQQGNGPI